MSNNQFYKLLIVFVLAAFICIAGSMATIGCYVENKLPVPKAVKAFLICLNFTMLLAWFLCGIGWALTSGK